MKKLILVIVMTLGLIAQTRVTAQKVYKEGDKIILDLTEDAGMPAGAITNAKKYLSFTPSATVLGTNNDHTGSINKEVYHKLEIAPSNLGSTSKWVDAFNGCKGATINGSTGWRLPTQRELMLIYIFKPAIEGLGSTTFTSNTYWSATETNATNAWRVSFSNGNTTTYTKTNPNYVRCVREID